MKRIDTKDDTATLVHIQALFFESNARILNSCRGIKNVRNAVNIPIENFIMKALFSSLMQKYITTGTNITSRYESTATAI
jgi:hypothetical protein